MIALLCSVALADEPVPMTGYAGHPFTLARGEAVFGLFRPATVGLSDRVDVTVPGLATLVAPRVDAKVEVWSGERVGVAVRGAVGIPSGGLALLRSTATVLSTDPLQRVGFGAVVDLGVIGGVREGRLHSSLGVAVRAGGSTGSLQPQGVWWLDPMLAPLTEGPVVRVRWVADLRVTDRVQLTGDVAHQVFSGGPDTSVRGLALLAPSERVAFGLGWALALETMPGGVDTFGMPLLDLQVRLSKRSGS